MKLRVKMLIICVATLIIGLIVTLAAATQPTWPVWVRTAGCVMFVGASVGVWAVTLFYGSRQGPRIEFQTELDPIKTDHNPYFPMVSDDLYYKYGQMGGNINITGAAFEEMVGVRDSEGNVTDPEVIARAHEIAHSPGSSGHYLEALKMAKYELRDEWA